MSSHKENEECGLAVSNLLLSAPKHYGCTNPTLLWTSFLQPLMYSSKVKQELGIIISAENEQSMCESQAENNSGLQITYFQASYYQYFDLYLKETKILI